MFKSKYGVVGPGRDEPKDTRIDNSICQIHGCKMTLLAVSYVCDICDPPKQVESKPLPPSWEEREQQFKKDMFGISPKRIVLNKAAFNGAGTTPVGTSFNTPKSTSAGTTWYVYSRKHDKNQVDGYKLYDDLNYLKGKCTRKAGKAGCKYYIYEVTDPGDDFVDDVNARRPTCTRSVDVAKVWESP